MTDTDLSWLAGLLEGEGSFLRGPPSDPSSPRISVQMTDEDVVQKVRLIVGHGTVGSYQDKKNPRWKRVFFFTVKGFPAVDLMQRLYPLMGMRRQRQIDKALSSSRPSRRRLLLASEVRKIRALLSRGLSDREVARQTGHAHSCVGRIRRGQSYAEVL